MDFFDITPSIVNSKQGIICVIHCCPNSSVSIIVLNIGLFDFRIIWSCFIWWSMLISHQPIPAFLTMVI
jgi:hypothetical protein